MDRPYTGKWFEELTPGLVIPHAIRRTITESDNVMFMLMTMNPAWLHLDFDYAENETEFGKPIVNFDVDDRDGDRDQRARDHTRHHRRQSRVQRGRVPGPAVPR